MRRLVAVLCLGAAGCSSPPANAPQPADSPPVDASVPPVDSPTVAPAESDTGDSEVASDSCSADAVARRRAEQDDAYAPSEFEAASEPPDLDGDGVADAVLIAGGGMRNATHYFLLKRGECFEVVGVISASSLLGGFYCGNDRSHGLCDLGISRMMIHGETEHSTYRFDGKTYVKFGRATLGPRPPKFK